MSDHIVSVNIGFPLPGGFIAGQKNLHCHFLATPFTHIDFAKTAFSNAFFECYLTSNCTHCQYGHSGTRTGGHCPLKVIEQLFKARTVPKTNLLFPIIDGLIWFRLKKQFLLNNSDMHYPVNDPIKKGLDSTIPFCTAIKNTNPKSNASEDHSDSDQ